MMSNEAKRKPVVLITGSTQRTGKDIAIQLAGMADTVIVQSRTEIGAAETLAKIEEKGAKAFALHGDAGCVADAAVMIKDIHQQVGRVDVLINNVGHYVKKPILDTDFELWMDLIHSSVSSTFVMSKAVLPMMMAQQYGRIINIVDACADRIESVPETTPYMIGKTGVLILTKSLATSCAHYNITVNAVSPGVIDNSTTKPPIDAIPSKRYAKVRDVVSAIRYFLDPGSEYVTGANIKVSGGWQV